MQSLVADRVQAALDLLSMEAEGGDGKPLPHTYTIAEDLYRLQSAIGGGPFQALGDRIKDACVELRLALIEIGK